MRITNLEGDDPQPFLLGANYWPRKRPMDLWKTFDIDEVHDDFATLSELGIDVIRLFLLWEDFQPDPSTIRCASLAHLLQACDAAAAEGLKVDLTFFVGHLGGCNWAPSWLVDHGVASAQSTPLIVGGRIVRNGMIRSPYDDAEARRAAVRLVRGVAKAIVGHSAVRSYDLGHEPERFVAPNNSARAADWLRELAQAIHNVDAERPITCGLHADSLVRTDLLRVDQVFAHLDFSVVHAAVPSSTLSDHSLDNDFVSFACALVAALTNKPCLLQSWGLKRRLPQLSRADDRSLVDAQVSPPLSEQLLAKHVGETLSQLVDVGATGAYLSCFSDDLCDGSDGARLECGTEERSFGLLRCDGTPRPHAEVLRRFAESNPIVKPAVRRVNLNMSADEYYANPAEHLQRLYFEFKYGSEATRQ